MSVRLRCQCGQKLTLPEQKPGLRVQCPVCNEYLTIPDAPPHGATELVAAATTKVQAELVAAIAGERKPQPAPLAAKNPPRSKKGQTRRAPPKSIAKERPLASPPKTIPAVAPPRPEPRTPAPRATPQPPPRRPQATSAAAEKPVASKPAPSPPPLPTTKGAAPPAPPAPAAAPEPALAPMVAIKIAPPEPQAPPAAPKPATSLAKLESTTNEEPVAPPMRGVEHDPAKRLTVYQLGFGLAMLALASSYPAVMEIVRHLRDPLSPGVETWTYLLLMVCSLQLVYALYLVQLPDWSSVWVTMIVTATIAFLYAVGMGMSLMAGSENEIIAVLGLSQLHAGGYLSLWCLLLTLLTALLSYAMVRTSVKWQKLFDLAMAHAQQ